MRCATGIRPEGVDAVTAEDGGFRLIQFTAKSPAAPNRNPVPTGGAEECSLRMAAERSKPIEKRAPESQADEVTRLERVEKPLWNFACR